MHHDYPSANKMNKYLPKCFQFRLWNKEKEEEDENRK
jgi:hypothetical protein